MLTFFENFLVGLTEFARRAGIVFVAAFVAATALAGWHAVGNLKVNTDTSAMLDPSLDFQQRASALREAFPDIKNDVAVIIRAPTIDEADAFAALLRSRALEKPELFASVFAPSVDPFFADNGLLYLSPAELETRLAQMTKAAGLIEALVKTPTAGQLFSTLAENDTLAAQSDLGRETLDRIYDELAAVIAESAAARPRPFSWMGAIAGEGATSETRIVFVTPKLDYARLQPAKPAIAALRAEIGSASAEFDGRIETFITGDPALRADELASVANGIELSFLISFLSVGVLLLICYRSFFLSAITLAALVISIVLTSAFAAVAVRELNLVSVAFTVLMVGLGIDYAIHLLLHFQEQRRAGEAPGLALKNAVRKVGAGLILAALTTSLGFFAFIPTDFRGIAQLGVIAGVGVIVALIVTLTFIPAAIGAFGSKETRAKGATPARPRTREIGAVQRFLAFAVIAAGAASLFLLPKARFDADPMALRNPASQSVVGFNLLFEDKNTTPYRLTRLVATEEEARATVERARALDAVGGARTLLDFIPEDQEDKLDLIDFASGSLVFAFDATEDKSGAPSARQGADVLAKRLENEAPESAGGRLKAALAGADEAALARAEANIFAYWPMLIERLKTQFNADYVEADSLPAALKTRYLSADGQWRVDILPKEDVRNPAMLRQFVDSVAAEFPDIAGGALQSRKAGAVIARAMIEASAIALGVIAIFLWVLMRNFKDVLLMLFPLGLAAVLTAAASVLLDIPFNYANVIVLPLLLGIGVDSGIHLVMRERQEARGEIHTNSATSRAVFFSAATTVASFGSLILSAHRGTASMGELLSIAIALTLVSTLIVLPVAYRMAHGRAAA